MKFVEDLDQALGIDPNDPEVKRAEAQFNSDANMLDSLVQMRKDKGFSRQDVANATGLSVDDVVEFESYDRDPNLSTVQLYANAISAFISHKVENDSDGRSSKEKQAT